MLVRYPWQKPQSRILPLAFCSVAVGNNRATASVEELVRIAFDLDDTLLPLRGRFSTEDPSVWPYRWFVHEALREGSRALLHALAAQHQLWIYTSSYRSWIQVTMLFRSYGIKLDGVVNADRHEREVVELRALKCLKYPPAFGIDVLIDDSIAVAREGARLGYRVLHIDPFDDCWTDRIRDGL